MRVGSVRIGHGVKADVTKIRHLSTDSLDDVALFRLAKPVKTQHVKLAEADPCKGSVVNIYGYGSYGTHPRPLRKATNRVSASSTTRSSGGPSFSKSSAVLPSPATPAGPPSTRANRSVSHSGWTSTAVAAHRAWIGSVTGV